MAAPPAAAPPPLLHPPCSSYNFHLHHFGLRPFLSSTPLSPSCLRSSLHSSTSREDVKASFVSLERLLTTGPPHLLDPLCDLILDDLAFTSRDLLASPSSPTAFSSTFLSYGHLFLLKRLLHAYGEQTTHNKELGHHQPPLHHAKHGSARPQAQTQVQPVDAVKVWGVLREVVAWTVAVWGAVGGVGQGVLMEGLGIILRRDDANAVLWNRLRGEPVKEMQLQATGAGVRPGRGEEEATGEEATKAAAGGGGRATTLPPAPSPTPSHAVKRRKLGPALTEAAAGSGPPWAAAEASGGGEEEEEEDADSDHAVGCSEDEEEEEEMEEDDDPTALNQTLDTAGSSGADLSIVRAAVMISARTGWSPLDEQQRSAGDELRGDSGGGGAVGESSSVYAEDEEADDESETDAGEEPARFVDAFGQRKDPVWLRRKLAGESTSITFPSPPPSLPPLHWPYPVHPAPAPAPSPPPKPSDPAAVGALSPGGGHRRLRKTTLSPPPPRPPSPPLPFPDVLAHLLPADPRGYTDWHNPADCFNHWHTALIDFFGEQGGFSLLLSALPPAPSTTHTFLLTLQSQVAFTPILTPDEHSACVQQPRPPLVNLVHLLNLIDWVMMARLRQHVAIPIYLLMVPRMMCYFLTLTDAQLQREPKQLMSDVISRIAILTSHQAVQLTLPILPHVERFEADFSLYLLRCVSLEKRIHGLSHLKKFVECAHPTSPTSSPTRRPLMDHFHSLHQRPSSSSFLSLPSFPAYLQRAGIIETLFGDNLHVQLLRRSITILRVMSQYHCVSPAQVELMWSASRGQHETVSAQVHSCLLIVVGHLADAALNSLLDRLKALSITDMDAHTVTLVRAIVWASLGGGRDEDHRDTTRAAPMTASEEEGQGEEEEDDEEEVAPRGEEHVSRRGLDFLWQQFNSRQPALNALRTDLFHHLKALLLSLQNAAVRQSFMTRCVDNLQASWNVPYSLWLLSDLIETYGPSPPSSSSLTSHTTANTLPTSPFKQFMSQGTVTAVSTSSPAFGSVVNGTPLRRGMVGRLSRADDRSDIIDLLDSDYGLIEAFFREIAAFSSQISPPANQQSAASPSPSPAPFFPYSLSTQLQMRLTFLEYVYHHCDHLRFSYDHIALLWSHFISPLPPPPTNTKQPQPQPPSPQSVFDPDARDILFTFLLSVFSSRKVDSSLAPRVFTQLVPLLPFSSLSAAGFQLFRSLFQSINLSQGKLVANTTSSPPQLNVRVAPSSLSGFEWLWAVACSCVHESVSVDAMKLLQQLHVQVEAEALSRMNESYELCIGKAMQHIGRATEQLHDIGDREGPDVDQLNMEIDRCFSILNLFFVSPTVGPAPTVIGHSPPSFDQPLSYPQAPTLLSPPHRLFSSPSPLSTSPSPSNSPLLLPPLPLWPRFPATREGGLLYLSEDMHSLSPPQQHATLIEVNVSYPRDSVDYGLMQTRVHSHCTVDELAVLITALSMLDVELIACSHLIPFPFPLMDLWLDGSSPVTVDMRSRRLESLVKEGQPYLDVKLGITPEPHVSLSPACSNLACSALLPYWMSVCAQCNQMQPADGRRDLVDCRARMELQLLKAAKQWSEHNAGGLADAAVGQQEGLRAMLVSPSAETSVRLMLCHVRQEKPEATEYGLSQLAVLLTPDGYPLSRDSPHYPPYEERRQLWDKEGKVGGELRPGQDRDAKSLTIVLRKDRADGFSAGEKDDSAALQQPLSGTDRPPPPQSGEGDQLMEDVADARHALGRNGVGSSGAGIVHPSVILSREEYFDQLFAILSLARSNRTGLSEKCWQLLMRLGDNQPMMNRLQTLTTPPSLSSPQKGRLSLLHSSKPSTAFSTSNAADELHWDVLLDPYNLAKLQYSLMLVQTLMRGPQAKSAADVSPTDANPTSSASRLRVEVDTGTPSLESPGASTGPAGMREGGEWERRFVSKGGLKHLLRILQVNDSLLSSIPLPSQSEGSGPAAPLSFHQSLSLQCLTTLIETITALIPLTFEQLVAGSPPAAFASDVGVDSAVADGAAATSTAATEDMDMASTSRAKRKAEEAGADEQQQPGLKRIKSVDLDLSPPSLSASDLAPAPAPDSLFNLELMQQLLRQLLHCASLPLYQPSAASTSPASRSFNSILSSLLAMDGQIADGAASLSKLIPIAPATTSSIIASSFPIDSPSGPSTTFIGPSALSLSLPSPSSSNSNSSFPAIFAPLLDAHRDEVTAAFFQLISLFSIGLSALPPPARLAFFTPSVFESLLHTCLLSSPRLCIRQATDISLSRFFASLLTVAQEGPQLVERLWTAAMQLLLTTTPLEQLQGRYRHQTESLFALMLRTLAGCLHSAIDFSSPTLPAHGNPHLHSLELCRRLFHLLQSLQAEQESDGVADQTVLGLLHLTSTLVTMHQRFLIDPSTAEAPPAPVNPTVIRRPYSRDATRSTLAQTIASSSIIHFLYSRGLFDVLPVHSSVDLVRSTSVPPLFRFTATRFACFELLSALASTSPRNFLLLVYLSMRSHAPRPDLTSSGQFNYQPALHKKPAAIPYVGLHNLGATCMPAKDTRVLTDCGFLFLHELEERIAAGYSPLYACYDTRTQSLMYRPGKIVLSAPPTRWVDFTQASTRALWSADSSDYCHFSAADGDDAGANHLTVRTTPEHEMFVQMESGRDGGSLPPQKLTALELAPGYRCSCEVDGVDCPHGYPMYRMFTAATQGIGRPINALSTGDRALDSPIVALRLRTDEQLCAFLELYGYWMHQGSLSASSSALCCPAKTEAARVYLSALMQRLRLREGVEWTTGNAIMDSTLLIRAPRWFHYFDVEYGGSDCEQSAKKLWGWVLQRLGRDQLRLILSGLHRARAGGVGPSSEGRMSAASVPLREQLMQLCMHAGYSAYFTLDAHAGKVRGYTTVPADGCTYTPDEMEDLKARGPGRVFEPLICTEDSWCVHFSDSTSELLPAQDVRFDGGRIQPRGEEDGQLSSSTPVADAYDEARDGRVFCVSVEHCDHLIFVQRAHVDVRGVVTKAGRPMVVSNCYMNSLMQQLFFTPPIRYGLFVQSFTDGIQRSDKEASESLLYQLQLLMGMLQESGQKFYDARSFCSAYRDYEGQCMQQNVQMDVNEFANILFDQVERELKAHRSPQQLLLQEVYGGKVSNQLICQECGNRNERDEDYFMLSLDVKNQHSITHSLSMYTEGELLQGDNKATCTRCDKKVDTLKRVCIKHLPPHLILHLKRFEFDLDSMRKYKVNDFCEFPMELDLFPYTKEGLEQKEREVARKEQDGPAADGAAMGEGVEEEKDDKSLTEEKEEEKEENGVAAAASELTPIQPPSHYRFELSGVLVHTGTCNSGHYYSFVKERVGSQPSSPALSGSFVPSTPPPRWFSCNDTNVELLAVESLKEACFGGGELVQSFDPTTRKTVSNFVPKTYSAYMLWYDRVDLHTPQAPQQQQPTQPSNFADAAQDKHTPMLVDTALPSSTPAASASPVDRAALSQSPPSALPEWLPSPSASSLVPPLIFRSIWEQNTQFSRDCFLFDAHHFQFVWRQVKAGMAWWAEEGKDIPRAVWDKEDDERAVAGLFDDDEALQQLPPPSSSFVAMSAPLPLAYASDVLYHSGKLGIHFLLHTYSHAKMKQSVEGWDTALRCMLEQSHRLSHYLLSLLASRRQLLLDLFLLSTQVTFRAKWNELILTACHTLTHRYTAAFHQAAQLAQTQRLSPPRPPTLHPTVVDYLRQYLSFLPVELQEYLKSCSTYFSFLVAFIHAHPSYLSFVFGIPHLFPTLLQFFISTDAPSDCPVTGISRSTHSTRRVYSRTAPHGIITAYDEGTAVLLHDGNAKKAKAVIVGDVLVSPAGEQRRVKEVYTVVEERRRRREEEDEEDVETDSVWTGFWVEGGDDYLLADLSIVRNEEGAVIGDRRYQHPPREEAQWDSEEDEEEEEESNDAVQHALLCRPDVEREYFTSPLYPGIPRCRFQSHTRLTLDGLHAALRKMRQQRKKFSEKLKPFAIFFVSLLQHGWSLHPNSTAFFPFLPFRQARLLCSAELFAALCEVDSLPERTFFYLGRNVLTSVHLIAVQLTEEINKTAHSGLAHLFTLLFHFLAIQDVHTAARIRKVVGKLTIVIKRNDKYEKEYPAMLLHLAVWFEGRGGGATATEEGMDEKVQAMVRDELVVAMLGYNGYPITSDTRDFRAEASRLMVALATWETKQETATREEVERQWRMKKSKEASEQKEDSSARLPPPASDSKMDDTGVEEKKHVGRGDASATSASVVAAPAPAPAASESVCQRIFAHLLQTLPTCTPQAHARHHDKQAFADYFYTLTTLLQHHPPLIALVTPHCVQLVLDLMHTTNTMQVSRDPTKAHTISFIFYALSFNPALRYLLTESPTSGMRAAESMANVHMYHDANSANIAYNEESLTQLFSVLLWACEQSPTFLSSLQHNAVFDWAVYYLHISHADMYPRCSAKVKAVKDRVALAEEDGDWRRKQIAKLFPRGTPARPSDAKQAETTLSTRPGHYIELMLSLMRTREDTRAVVTSWFVQSLTVVLERQWLGLAWKVHEDALLLFSRLLAWYHAVTKANDAVNRSTFENFTFQPTSTRALLTYLAHISTLLKVIKPQPPPPPSNASAATAPITAAAPGTLQKATTRGMVKQGGLQPGGPLKTVKPFVPRPVAASTLQLSSRELMALEPVEQLSGAAQAMIGDLYSHLSTPTDTPAIILHPVSVAHAEQMNIDLAANESFLAQRLAQLPTTGDAYAREDDVQECEDECVFLSSLLPASHYEALLPVLDDVLSEDDDVERLREAVDLTLHLLAESMQMHSPELGNGADAHLLPVSSTQQGDERRLRMHAQPPNAPFFHFSYQLVLTLWDYLTIFCERPGALLLPIRVLAFEHRLAPLLFRLVVNRHPGLLTHRMVAWPLVDLYLAAMRKGGERLEDCDRRLFRAVQRAHDDSRWRELAAVLFVPASAMQAMGAAPAEAAPTQPHAPAMEAAMRTSWRSGAGVEQSTTRTWAERWLPRLQHLEVKLQVQHEAAAIHTATSITAEADAQHDSEQQAKEKAEDIEDVATREAAMSQEVEAKGEAVESKEGEAMEAAVRGGDVAVAEAAAPSDGRLRRGSVSELYASLHGTLERCRTMVRELAAERKMSTDAFYFAQDGIKSQMDAVKPSST